MSQSVFQYHVPLVFLLILIAWVNVGTTGVVNNSTPTPYQSTTPLPTVHPLSPTGKYCHNSTSKRRCPNGKCVWASYYPLFCTWYFCEAYREWKCKDKYCIEKRHVCDGIPHCRDKSDETESACSPTPKPDEENYYTTCARYEEWKCPYTSKCILIVNKCDGIEDCADGADEDDYTCNRAEEPNDATMTAMIVAGVGCIFCGILFCVCKARNARSDRQGTQATGPSNVQTPVNQPPAMLLTSLTDDGVTSTTTYQPPPDYNALNMYPPPVQPSAPQLEMPAMTVPYTGGVQNMGTSQNPYSAEDTAPPPPAYDEVVVSSDKYVIGTSTEQAPP